MIPFYGLDYTYYDHPNLFSLVLYSGGCNLSCYGCHNRTLAGWDYESKEKSQKKHLNILQCNTKLSQEEVKMAVQNPMIDMIILCGGEFLIFPIQHIIDTLNYLKELNPNIFIRIDTNGSFPEKVEKIIALNQVDGFAIDIKGPYWDNNYYDSIINVLGVSSKYGEKVLPKMVESIKLSSKLEKTLYRTVLYPTIKDSNYFEEIKKYVGEKLKKPHFFNSYVDL